MERAFGRLSWVLEVPDLVQGQREAFAYFVCEGIKKLLVEISPVVDPGGRFKLYFCGYKFGTVVFNLNGKGLYSAFPDILSQLEKEAPYPIEECKERGLTYAVPWHILLRLEKKEGEVVEQWVYFGNFPIMTKQGTFIINGAERVVVNQLIRAPGVYFLIERGTSTEHEAVIGQLIPDHGGWIEFGGSPEGYFHIKLAGRHKIPVTALFQALGYSREEIKKLFSSGEENPLQNTFEWADKEYSKLFKRSQGITNEKEALSYFSVKFRPSDYPNPETASAFLKNLLENARYFNMGEIGRYKLNRKLGLYRKYAQEMLSKLKKIKLDSDFLISRLEKAAQNNSDEVLPLLKELLERKTLKKELCEELTNTIKKLEDTRLSREDLVEIVRHLIMVSRGEEMPDDLDFLGNRRVRTVADLLYNHLRVAFIGLEYSIKEQMSLIEPKRATPKELVNVRLIHTTLKEAYTISSLSQFLDQTNPLAELTHKRRLSATGPGGLSREHAGFEVRDVHYSHYGRICPIETPEGTNIGLITSMAIYARRNYLGLLETPYRRVVKELENTNPQLIGRKVRQIVRDDKGRFVTNPGIVTGKIFERLSQLPLKFIPIIPYVSSEIVYLLPDKEDEYKIAPATTKLNERGEFVDSKIEVRHRGRYLLESPLNVDFMEISPQQMLGVSASLIPFLEHDDANRALMGANMQRQAVPLLRPQAPLVQTGMEEVVAQNSGQVIRAKRGGIVSSVTSASIVIETEQGEIDEYPLIKFERNNQRTCINQWPVVTKGQRVNAGDILADSSTSDGGKLALGRNLLVAFMSWEGYNFEDAIVVSEAVVREDCFTSIHIERYEIDAKETKLGPEEITREIPGVGEERLKNLDEEGIVRIGAEVEAGDILVGKLAYKGETELTAEERLLSVIFGEKARDVTDISLYLPHGEKGKVIKVRSYHRDQYPDLGPGVIKKVQVWVAQKRKLSVGDKLAGRHGNKGVVSIIVPVEDMPFLPDGRPVEVILNPIGVPSRMNLGQILETHLGAAAYTLGFKAVCPPFEGASIKSIEEALAQAWLVGRSGAIKWEGERPIADLEKAKEWVEALGYEGEKVFSPDADRLARMVCLRIWLKDQGVDSSKLSDEEVETEIKKLAEQGVCPPIYGEVYLRDGRTGEFFDQPVTVGHIYLMKLIHLAEDKIHARSLGPYSLITQQPLGGRAKFGGQRFGEMEVWALEAYGAAHTLQEMLTVKSDDVPGRTKTYEALIKGEDIIYPGIPESFKVLALELKSLGLNIEILPSERAIKELPEGS